MMRLLKWGGQAIVYTGMALWLGYFANSPAYTHLDPKLALIKLSVIHSAQRRGECRKRTQQELEALNPNMRKPYDCPRERLPIHIELLLDGELVYDEILQPAGLSKGSQTRAYQRLPATPGEHRLIVRMVDSARTEGYDYLSAAKIRLAAGEIFVVDFRAETGGFILRGPVVETLSEG